MPISDALSFASMLIAMVSVFFVVVQLYNDTAQRRIESLVQVLSINRELLVLGFSRPDLFNVLLDGNDVDPEAARRFIQLWLNQMSLVFAIQKRGFFEAELRESLERDMTEFFSKPHVQQHWRSHRTFYPASFQTFVDRLLPGSLSSTNPCPVQGP